MGLVVLTAGPGAVVASESRILKRRMFRVALERCEAADALVKLYEQSRAQSKLTRIASRNQGEKEGNDRALQKLAERLTRVAMAERIELEQIRPILVELVSNAVGSVLQALDRRIWFDQVLHSVERELTQCSRVQFTVHPDSVEALEQAIGALPYTIKGTVRIVTDGTLGLDVCEVASDYGFATSSIDAQVRSIERAVDALIAGVSQDWSGDQADGAPSDRVEMTSGNDTAEPAAGGRGDHAH